MPRLQRKSFEEPDEVREFPNGYVRLVSLDEVVVGDFHNKPGWRWSTDVRPIVGTELCQHRHVGFVVSGRLHVVMGDGTQMDFQPGDVLEIPPDHDAWVVGDEDWHSIEWTSARVFAVGPGNLGEGIVATLLFTDIVGSTSKLAEIGDDAWKDLLLAHNAVMRQQLDTFRGRELATTGDGFLAMFDSASRAVRCGKSMTSASRESGLDIRVGCHTGELQIVGGEARGMAVHAAARVMSLADAGEVFVSPTTRDLLSGSGIEVKSRGEFELKGLAGPREIFSVEG